MVSSTYFFSVLLKEGHIKKTAMSLSVEPGSNKCQVRSGVVAHGCTWSQSLVTSDDFLGIYILLDSAKGRHKKFKNSTHELMVVSSKITMRCDSQRSLQMVSQYKPSILGYPYFWKHPHFKLLISRNSMSFWQIDMIIWGKFWWFEVKRDGGIHDKTEVFHNQLSSHQDIGRLVV